MPDFRRGADAIKESQKKAAQGGSFKAFTPTLFWQDPAKDASGAERYLMFLNKLEDIPNVDLIGFIPQKGKKGNGDTFTYYESVIARTDSAIGESSDPLTEEYGAQPRETNVAVAVELEPVLEERNGRKRAVGFEVATTVFDRRIRDDNGDLTDETEEVEAPVIGFVQQSPHNFFNLVVSFDEDTGPIESTALKIKRIDKKTYTVEGYLDVPVDLTPLVDGIDNLSYLKEDEADDILDAIDGVDDQEAAEIIGEFLLDKRLDELSDEERYQTLFDSLPEDTNLNPFGGKDSKKGGKKERSRRERPQRRSSRRSAKSEDEPQAEEPQAEEEKVEEKPARRRRSRAKDPEPEVDSVTAEDNAQEPEAEDAPDAPEPEVEEKPKRSSRSSASKTKLDELREKQAKRRSAA